MTSRGPYRRRSAPFKLQLCQDIRAGVIGRRDAQRTHHISANLIHMWLTQFDRGELSSEEAEASVIAEYEAKIAALKTFDLVYMTTSGGPGNATTVPSYEVYDRAFQLREVGSASAVAIVLTALVFAINLVVTRIGERES